MARWLRENTGQRALTSPTGEDRVGRRPLPPGEVLAKIIAAGVTIRLADRAAFAHVSAKKYYFRSTYAPPAPRWHSGGGGSIFADGPILDLAHELLLLRQKGGLRA